jgi:hypothetical protein
MFPASAGAAACICHIALRIHTETLIWMSAKYYGGDSERLRAADDAR